MNMTEMIAQESINELVDRFYDKLTKEQYFIELFSKREVNVENLKNRQREFLYKLANTEAANEHTNRVNRSHAFQMSREGAELWMNTMVETIRELEIEEEAKTMLIEKIQYLLKNLLHK
jgi:truncated hemoglobin YjbI